MLLLRKLHKRRLTMGTNEIKSSDFFKKAIDSFIPKMVEKHIEKAKSDLTQNTKQVKISAAAEKQIEKK